MSTTNISVSSPSDCSSLREAIFTSDVANEIPDEPRDAPKKQRAWRLSLVRADVYE